MADSREGAGQKHFRKHCCSVHNLCTLEMQRIPLIASETPWGGPSEPCPRLLPPARSYWGSLLPNTSRQGCKADAVARSPHTAARELLEQLLPEQPEVVEEVLECITAGLSWKKVRRWELGGTLPS